MGVQREGHSERMDGLQRSTVLLYMPFLGDAKAMIKLQHRYRSSLKR